MAYADYAFYTGTFKGNAIPEAEFNRLAEQASVHIDTHTFDRAKDYTDTDSKLRKACCALCDVIYKYEKGGPKTSESVGNYSVSYALDISNTKTLDQQLLSTIKLYLGLTGLLYGGG